METFKKPIVFFVLSILTFVVATLSVLKRMEVENGNRRTVLAIEWDAIQNLGLASNTSVDQSIELLKKAGVNGVALSEQTLGDLFNEGKVQAVSPNQFVLKVPRNELDATLNRINMGLNLRGIQSEYSQEEGFRLLNATVSLARSATIGIDPSELEGAKRAGWYVIGRFGNPSGVNTRAITTTLELAKEQGVRAFLPLGEQVLGRRDAMDTTISALQSTGLLYLSPEFAKLGGDDLMLNKVTSQVVRLHAAQSAELDKLSLGAAVERYRKAASERNMRVLLIRPLTSGAENPIGAFADFIKQIRTELAKDKISIGEPRPFADPAIPSWMRIAIGLFAGLAAAWTLVNFRSDGLGAVAGFLAIALIVTGLFTQGKGRDISVLMMTLVFPVGGLVSVLQMKWNAWLATIAMASLAMLGGWCVAAVLNGPEFYARAETFWGVKISVFFPIVVVGIYSFHQLSDIRRGLASPITWGAAFLSLAILAALALMIMRTGNDNPNAVSGGEMAFRGFLETVLPVRPRTKDFLIGFPSLLLGLLIFAKAGYDPRRLGNVGGWVALLLMLGTIGLTDVVNTLCHLHTPVKISVIRNVLGLAFGLGFGGVIWLLVRTKIAQWIQPVGAGEVPFA